MDTASLLARIEHAFEFSQKQVRSLVERDPGFYPLYTEKGRWRHDKPAWTHWCDGFLPGMMWIFYEESGEAYWRRLAESYSRPLEPRKDDRKVHDLGFIFYHGAYKRWYDATVREGAPDQSLKDVIIHAGRTLALRFNERAGCLCSFHGPDSNFIDIMMNVGIIFYAALETGDRSLLELAHRHSKTTKHTLVRKDGSTAHEGVFDPKTGEFLRQSTQQGYSPQSCWSRGLAWSLYGFCTCYELTGEPEYLETSQMNADYWLAHLDAGNQDYGVVPWDFDAPRQGPLSRKVVDTSASAIASCGLINLAHHTADAERRQAYQDCALRTVFNLSSKYLGEVDGWEGILRGGVYHIHKGLGVNESVIWGDFFFVEALQRTMRMLRKG
jgi:unsaturated chondroitin disaccharide hydrolase